MDSYFGEIGHSFYGGPNGQSFYIKQTFSNKKELDTDLTLGLSSPIKVSEYVSVFYGITQSDYDINKDIDIAIYGNTYNATIWQKVFSNEEFLYKPILSFEQPAPNLFLKVIPINPAETTGIKIVAKGTQSYLDRALTIEKRVVPLSTPVYSYSSDYGSYRLVHQTGDDDGYVSEEDVFNSFIVDDANSQPPFDVLYDLYLPNPWNIAIGQVTTGTANSQPIITINGSATNPSSGSIGTDTKYIHFRLPSPWNIAKGQVAVVNPNIEPNVTINGSATDPSSSSIGTDTKYIHFSLPKPWNISSITSASLPQNNPNVSITEDLSLGIKIFNFSLPRAWDFRCTYASLASDERPKVVINRDPYYDEEIEPSTDGFKYIHFSLPVSQIFDENSFEVSLGTPTSSPTAVVSYNSIDTLKQHPYVSLSLPRPATLNGGTALEAASNQTISSSSTSNWNAVKDLEVGDIYINTTFAAMHKIISKTTNQIRTSYLGSLQLSVPTITTSFINAYNNIGDQNVPSITVNPVTQPTSRWGVTVTVPTLPSLIIETQFLSPNSSGTSNSIKQNNTLTWQVGIPRGSRILTTKENSNVLPGDIVIEGSSGDISQYNNNYAWDKIANFQGKNFQIKNETSDPDENQSIVIHVSDLSDYADPGLYTRMGRYIEDQYPAYASLKGNEVLNVSYYPDQSDATKVASYWLFKVSNQWSGAKLTGDLSNSVILTAFQTEDEDAKAYSATLINRILGSFVPSSNNNLKTLADRITEIERQIAEAWGELPVTN